MNTTTKGPLADLRILDMATVVAAPFASTLCADTGADGSDPLRGQGVV